MNELLRFWGWLKSEIVQVKWRDVVDFLAARMKERSSWLGLAAAMSAMGLVIDPKLQEQIIVCGVAVGGAILFFTED